MKACNGHYCRLRPKKRRKKRSDRGAATSWTTNRSLSFGLLAANLAGGRGFRRQMTALFHRGQLQASPCLMLSQNVKKADFTESNFNMLKYYASSDARRPQCRDNKDLRRAHDLSIIPSRRLVSVRKLLPEGLEEIRHGLPNKRLSGTSFNFLIWEK